jgi:hypothetical protein
LAWVTGEIDGRFAFEPALQCGSDSALGERTRRALKLPDFALAVKQRFGLGATIEGFFFALPVLCRILDDCPPENRLLPSALCRVQRPIL